MAEPAGADDDDSLLGGELTQNRRQSLAELYTTLGRRRWGIIGVHHHWDDATLSVRCEKFKHPRKGMAEAAVVARLFGIGGIKPFIHQAIDERFGQFCIHPIPGSIFRLRLF